MNISLHELLMLRNIKLLESYYRQNLSNGLLDEFTNNFEKWGVDELIFYIDMYSYEYSNMFSHNSKEARPWVIKSKKNWLQIKLNSENWRQIILEMDSEGLLSMQAISNFRDFDKQEFYNIATILKDLSPLTIDKLTEDVDALQNKPYLFYCVDQGEIASYEDYSEVFVDAYDSKKDLIVQFLDSYDIEDKIPNFSKPLRLSDYLDVDKMTEHILENLGYTTIFSGDDEEFFVFR